MTNSKSTKRALFSSVVALLLCFTMLLGTTFAWFTDSAASGSNVITAGNLDIVVEYTLDGTTWNNLDGATDLFQKGLWEPGHTEVVALRIKNNGTLALKYAANMNIVSEEVGKTKDGADIVLSDILTVSTLIQQANDIGDIALGLAFSGENSVAYENTTTFKAGNVLGNDVQLQPGAAHYLFVKVDMAETVGNEANHNGTDVPTINFGINVLATQFTYENDSFGNQYDKDAEYDDTIQVNTAEELRAALANGGNIKLMADIEIDTAQDNNRSNIFMEDVGDVVLDLNGHKITTADADACMFETRGNTNLTFTGDGTIVFKYALLAPGPGSKIVFENGTYLRDDSVTGEPYNTAIIGMQNNTIIVNGGYFDVAVRDADATANNLFRLSSGQKATIYNGIFVNWNPNVGDVRNLGYYLEGQTEKNQTPDGYTITEDTTADGRPTYTVSYSK